MPVSFPELPASITPPTGQYAHIVAASGELISISGQIARGVTSDDGPEATIALQAEEVFAKIGALLEAVQLDFSAVVSYRTYVVGATNQPAYVAARRAIFERIHPDGRYPGNTMVVVAALGTPDVLLEVEALAVR